MTKNQINKKRADWNQSNHVNHDYRLSFRCDVHPASYWLQGNGSSFSLRLDLDDALDSIAPAVCSGMVPLMTYGVAVYPPFGTGEADVLWVKFSREANQLKLRANTIHLNVPVGMTAEEAYLPISKHIKGREWPVVVIEGQPDGYSDPHGEGRAAAGRLMYLIASRSTAVLYLIDKESPSRKEFLMLQATEAAKCEGYNPGHPGYLDAEFSQNIGLRWGKTHPSEPAIWWHLSWKNPQKEGETKNSPRSESGNNNVEISQNAGENEGQSANSRIKPLFGLNPLQEDTATEESNSGNNNEGTNRNGNG